MRRAHVGIKVTECFVVYYEISIDPCTVLHSRGRMNVDIPSETTSPYQVINQDVPGRQT